MEQWNLTDPFLAKILVAKGRVKALFSEATVQQFDDFYNLIASSGSRSEGLGPEGKVGASEILERAGKAVRLMYEEAVGKGYWKRRA